MSLITGYPITAGASPVRECARPWLRLRVDPSTGCHVWTGAKTTAGYGQFKYQKRRWLAHRWFWVEAHGPIPDGLTIDHLCRNRACVNPAHMEVVSQRENVLRGDTTSGNHARKTACLRGHPFTPENTYLAPPTKRKPRGQRQCRTCNYERQAARQRRQHKVQGERGATP